MGHIADRLPDDGRVTVDGGYGREGYVEVYSGLQCLGVMIASAMTICVATSELSRNTAPLNFVV